MPIGRIVKGNIIRATFLNDIAKGVDDLTREFASHPKQVLQTSAPEVQNQSAQDGDEVTDPAIYIESSRITSTVQVFDQSDENYAEIDRIDKVFFQNANGDTITLQFNNAS